MSLQHLLGLVDALREPRLDLAVILERGDRLRRHRVHRVGADQLLDVDHVAVVRVLRRRRGPEAALRARALRGQPLPALAAEPLLVEPVRELRVGDRRACRAARAPAAVPIASSRLSPSVSTRETKKLATDATFDGSPPASTSRSSPRMYASITSACRSQREDQRHVDVAAARDHLLDRAEAGLRGRDLDVEVGPVAQLVEALRLGDRALLVVREVGVDLPRDVAVRARRVASQTGRSRSHASTTSSWLRPMKISRGSSVSLQQLAQLLVVGAAVRDRLLEDRGVRGDADDGVVAHEAPRARRCGACRARGSRSRRSGRARRGGADGNHGH